MCQILGLTSVEICKRLSDPDLITVMRAGIQCTDAIMSGSQFLTHQHAVACEASFKRISAVKLHHR